VNAVAMPVQSDESFVLTINLLEAASRSDSIPRDWSQEQRARSLERYVMWLRLKQRHPRARLAPTRDIDLFWHLHMLSPVAYHRDCMQMFGCLLDHDGGFGRGPGELPKLQEVFTRTAMWWEQAYGEPYREDGHFMRDAQMTDCWHDCQDRCWHACASLE
jgi:hypothetical protein